MVNEWLINGEQSVNEIINTSSTVDWTLTQTKLVVLRKTLHPLAVPNLEVGHSPFIQLVYVLKMVT